MMKESTTTSGLGARSNLITRVEKVEDVSVVVPRSEMVAGGISRARQRRPALEQPRRPIERELSDVNKSADAFIQRFRQQLEIQRMQSLENYENMLARGT